MGAKSLTPKMFPWVSLGRAHAAQGGVTLEPEQGELGANFCSLGMGAPTMIRRFTTAKSLTTNTLATVLNLLRTKGYPRPSAYKIPCSKSMISTDWLAFTRQTLQDVRPQIPNARSLLQLLLLSTSRSSDDQAPLQGTSASCPNAQLSCHNSSAVADTCCFNAPGGQLLQTQYSYLHGC
jgi:hypothetical protein